MDEVKIVTKFTRGVVSKVIEMAVKKSLGYSAKIRVNDIAVTNSDESVHVHLDVEADLDHSELLKVLKGIGLG